MDGVSAVQGGLLEDGSRGGPSARPGPLPQPLDPPAPPDQWDGAQRKSPPGAADPAVQQKLGISLRFLEEDGGVSDDSELFTERVFVASDGCLFLAGAILKSSAGLVKRSRNGCPAFCPREEGLH